MPIATLQCEVQQDDIDHGLHCSCRKCPVALAVKRAAEIHWPDLRLDVVVSGFAARIYDFVTTEYLGGCVLALDIRRFIRNFDNREKDIQPFNFSLQLHKRPI
jgi:hypothetical protein